MNEIPDEEPTYLGSSIADSESRPTSWVIGSCGSKSGLWMSGLEGPGLGHGDPPSEKANGLNGARYPGETPGEHSKDAGVAHVEAGDSANTGEDVELIDDWGGCMSGPVVTIRIAGGVGRERSSAGGPADKFTSGHVSRMILSSHLILFSSSST